MSLSVEEIERVVEDHGDWGWNKYPLVASCRCGKVIIRRKKKHALTVAYKLYRRHLAQALQAALDAEKEPQ